MSDDRTPPELRRQIGRAVTKHVDLEAGVYVYESESVTWLCVREGTNWYRVWSGFRPEDMITGRTMQETGL